MNADGSEDNNKPGFGESRGRRSTALEQHVAFFDRDNDGIISPVDTFVGCRDIGFNLFLSLLSTIIIHVGFSWITWGWPDPFFRLKVRKMHKAKHGSDTEAYTTRGDFDENRFEYIFNMYSQPPHTHLSFSEGLRMLKGNRNPFDLFGWFAAAIEWLATYLLLWPADGRMKKEDVRGVYDGSLFYELSGIKKKD